MHVLGEMCPLAKIKNENFESANMVILILFTKYSESVSIFSENFFYTTVL